MASMAEGRRPVRSPFGSEGTIAVDAYLADAPPEHRAALQALRERIAGLVPDAVEGISYAIPGFKYRGRGLISYASFTAHCSVFPGAVAADYAQDLPGFKIAKGTIQFTPDHLIPDAVLERMIRDRVAVIDAGGR
ncbi:MAG TPA: DUF1801 domain-containing protein [Methylomirabilota bacterium]|nr:DUF1801 domain-containing protein [Methylomirabilota bacterium]